MPDYYLINTNAGYLPEGEDGTVIYEAGIVATFGPEEYAKKLSDLSTGDIIISYVNGVGYRAVGKVTEEWNGLEADDSDKIGPVDGREYHAEVEWQQVVPENEAIDWQEANKLLGYAEETPPNFTKKKVKDPSAGKRLADTIRGERGLEPDLYLVPTGRDSDNLQRTVERPVPKSTIEDHDPSVDLDQFASDTVPIWGHDGETGAAVGDVLLLHQRGAYRFAGTIGDIETNESLGEAIWENDPDESFTEIYYFDEITPLNVDDKQVAAIFDYSLEYPHPQNFKSPSFEAMARMRRKFGDIAMFVDRLAKIDFPSQYVRIADQLEETGQIVFYGPPGTGKTYHAKEFAERWVHEFPGTVQENRQTRFLTFHPSFTYEDFIEGITAKSEDGQIEYELDDGVLKDFVQSMSTWPGHENVTEDALGEAPRYVLIIDEINRGNIASILGETVTLLEADKRKDGENPTTVNLAHSNDEFGLPSNLYIIGTMNTADRSIALVDAAIRRRFGFIPFSTDYDALAQQYGLDPEAVSERTGEDSLAGLQSLSIEALRVMNDRIVHDSGLGKGKQIGQSYLWNADSEETLVRAWKHKVLPLLEEYFFGSFDDIDETVLQAEHSHYLIDRERQQVRTEFGAGTDISETDALRQVLQEVVLNDE